MQTKNIFQTKWLIALFAIFNLIGCIGLIMPVTKTYFQLFIPFNILFSFLLVLIFHTQFNRHFIFSLLIISVFGFLIEVLGVNTGKVFGSYYYHLHLGPKLWNVPLLIGLNWLLLIYCSASQISKLNYSIYLKSIIIATMMLLIDLALEIFAIENQMWVWTKNNHPPVQNYLAWWLVSFMMAICYLKINKEIYYNKIANAVLIIMFGFFILFDILTYLNS